jgi:hypothetical protein
MAAVAAAKSNVNGAVHQNGNVSRSSTVVRESEPQLTRTVSEATTSSTYSELTVVSKTWKGCRHKIVRELDDVNEAALNTSINSFLDFISSERLTDMPHRGGRWDKVLKSAEYFALQLAAYEELVRKFVRDSESALNLALACCRLLLEVCFSTA